MSGKAEGRDVRSFVTGRDPSIDRRFRPRPMENQKRILFDNGIDEDSEDVESSDSIENDENYDPSGATSSSCSEVGEEQDPLGALVYLRFRPTREESAFSARGNVLIVGPSSETMTTSNNKNAIEKQYVFSDIFHREIPQLDVYENYVRLKIDTEDSFTLMTYGTSGSGKTYTLLGTDVQPGIIPRSLEHIFSLYSKKIYPTPSAKLLNGRIVILEDRDLYSEEELRKSLLSNCHSNVSMETTRGIIRKQHNFQDSIDEDVSVFVWISFIEIYNENVYDLLEPPSTSQHTMMAPPARRILKIVGNDGNVFVKGLTAVYVKSSAEALHLLKYGLQRVNYAATSINHNSSRSHCIFTIDLLKYNRQGDCSHISYRFCDLAGSERLHKTGNVGSRLKEAQRINTSLLVLGRCLDAANSNSTRKKSHEIIPYRESKLTMLLQSALLGKEKLCMIVNIMPTDKYYEENINVLGFASIAKNIVFKEPSKKMHKSRCSFLSEHAQVSTAANEAHLDLLKENIFLRSEVGRLSETLDAVKMEHKFELVRFEQNLREKLAQKHHEMVQMQVRAAEERCKLEFASVERRWKQECESMKKKYEWEIEDLREELQNLKNSCRKRRTSDSLAAKSAKRPALDVVDLESDDDSENTSQSESISSDKSNSFTEINQLAVVSDGKKCTASNNCNSVDEQIVDHIGDVAEDGLLNYKRTIRSQNLNVDEKSDRVYKENDKTDIELETSVHEDNNGADEQKDHSAVANQVPVVNENDSIADAYERMDNLMEATVGEDKDNDYEQKIAQGVVLKNPVGNEKISDDDQEERRAVET